MDPSRFIQAGGGGIVPQTDAPTSASNAGERRVTIRCLQSSISLPVTPDTTPNEILYSAANLMTHNINPQTSVVLECYFSYGLERRLRRYERVRDVMNSWDRDTQHCLLIVPGDSVDKYPHLNLEGLVNFVLYHCNRPGKWNKRYITLMESGQVFFSKKKDAKLSDKDAVSLCHLSDFDIYEVTEKDMLKNIRPPKKNCIAIKSQQKNSVFQNTENFIHFFATDDSRLAGDFQRIIHGWRSWYLVNKKVDLTKKTKSHHSSVEKPASTASGLSRNGTVHRTRTSVDETPYTIGTFSPLLDMDKFDKPIDDYGKDSDRPAARPAEQLSTPRQTHKVVSRSRTTHSFSPPAAKKLIDPSPRTRSSGPVAVAGEKRHGALLTFHGGGSDASAAEPITPPAPRHLIASKDVRRRVFVFRQARDAAASRRPDPKVPHLPSAWRDAQGRGVKAPNGKPLIEMATGWDQPDAVLGPQLQTVTRMGTAKAYPPQRMASQSAASRPRSRSTAGGGAIRRVVSNEQPPVPSMPRRSSRRDDEDLPLINFVERDRGRDTKPSVAQGLGRSGTVRH
ncbi:LOW QUALITY PROTEIN: ubiquitin-like protein [Colletotrichum tofieldiae]|nr:LOW QUALITY PROTEIN: ubiquitin-like protein [Colletotrichum tofieldiae]